MSVSAQISIYPLRQKHLGPAIEAVRIALQCRGLEPEVGAMSTVVTADAERIFSTSSVWPPANVRERCIGGRRSSRARSRASLHERPSET